jgi:hypothetical protein
VDDRTQHLALGGLDPLCPRKRACSVGLELLARGLGRGGAAPAQACFRGADVQSEGCVPVLGLLGPCRLVVQSLGRILRC